MSFRISALTVGNELKRFSKSDVPFDVSNKKDQGIFSSVMNHFSI
jgi:hypothetical protein